MPDVAAAAASPRHLEQALFTTVRYFALQGLPVTATQMWRCLILPTEEAGVRWGGHHLYSLREVEQTLATSSWLGTRLLKHWGHYTLPEKGQAAVVERLRRHCLAQTKWKLLRRVAGVLAYVPFVRMLAVTGSLSFGNARPSSDLDLLVVVKSGRIWTARALLLGIAGLLGRRRRHWDRQAPDKACLNHYLTTRSLAIAPEIRNIFTAVLFTHAVPIYGQATYREFLLQNSTWYKRFIMYPEPLPLLSVQALRVHTVGRVFKTAVERWLQEPLGSWLERQLRHFQQRVIQHHTIPGRPGRIVVSDKELAFHPDSKMESILHRFHQEVGQQALL